MYNKLILLFSIFSCGATGLRKEYHIPESVVNSFNAGTGDLTGEVIEEC